MKRLCLHTACAALLAVLSGAIPGCGTDGQPPGAADDEQGDWPPAAFQGPSTQLKRTVVVPTLDTPMPPGKNVIWCASFQVAWNKLKDDLAKGPVELDRAQEIADRLNRAEVTEADLPEGSYYAAAGFTTDGIVNTIESEMQKRFGRSPQIQVAPTGDGCTAYAYLQARVKFDIPFFDSRKPLLFQEPGGQSVPVSSFGIREEDEYAYDRLRAQAEVLYSWTEKRACKQTEFAIDPCVTSSPNQLLLAYVPRKGTLAETIQYVHDKMESFADDSYHRRIGPNEQLLVPNMNWDIQHEFKDLKGAYFGNRALRGLYIEAALQDIKFRLDRGGAELESEAAVPCAPIPRYFYVEGPFLVYLKRRDAERPFFAIWVDNAELLCKAKPQAHD